MRDKVWFKNILSENGFDIEDKKLELLDDYCKLLIAKNQGVNLISHKSEANIWEEHILHSLSFLFKVKIKEDAKILDLGTGGGLPGIPLKIMFPKLDVTLLDSTQKKIIAVKEIINKLGLKNINAISGRAEELKLLPEMKENYDYVISRAVGKLDNIFKLSIPFLKKNHIDESTKILSIKILSVKILSAQVLSAGAILVLKGGDIAEEVRRIKMSKNLFYFKVIDIKFKGREDLSNPDKKIVIMYNK
jgi:16S rRNA (guanine527-N7)-methyltransferase